MIGSAFYLYNQEDIDGLIVLVSFGCGPGSFIKELIERKIQKEKSKPYMSLILDEHTAKTGIQTRLEAFLDMLEWYK